MFRWKSTIMAKGKIDRVYKKFLTMFAKIMQNDVKVELKKDQVSAGGGGPETKAKLIELGLVVLVVKVFRAKTQPISQTVAIAGPEEAFSELDSWWQEQTGRGCPIHNYLVSSMSNGFLVKDRWSQAVADGRAIATGAFNELGARL